MADMAVQSVAVSENLTGIVQLTFNKKQTRCLVVTASGPPGDDTSGPKVTASATPPPPGNHLCPQVTNRPPGN